MAKFTAIDFFSGTLILASEMNANFAALEALFDKGIGPDNIMSGGLGSAAHGDLSSITTTHHTTESIKLGACKTAGGFASSTSVDGALTKLAVFTGYSGGAGSKLQKVVGYSSVYGNYTTTSVVVPANIASTTNGVLVNWGAEIGGTAGTGVIRLPLRINGVDLMTTGDAATAPFMDFQLYSQLNIGGAGNIMNSCGRTSLINNTRLSGNTHVGSINFGTSNTISIGTPFTANEGGAVLSAWMVVYAY